MCVCESFNKIMALEGMDELKAFAGKLLQLRENRKNHNQLPATLPNLILAADPGCGTSLHIRMLTQLLEETELLPFMGEEKSFEWAITRKEDSFDYLLRRIHVAAGFYGQFCGVVGLDLSDILDERWPASAIRLMEYVDAQQGNILFVFVIPLKTNERLIDRLKIGFASRTPIELISTPFPKSDFADSYIKKALAKRGIDMDQAAQDSIRTAIEKMTKSPAFDGYQSMQNLIDELTWHVASKPQSDLLIRAADVEFLEDYLKLFASRSHEGKRLIGFDFGGGIKDE